MKKRLIAFVMVLSLVFGLCSFTVWADEEDESTQQTEEAVVTDAEETADEEEAAEEVIEDSEEEDVDETADEDVYPEAEVAGVYTVYVEAGEIVYYSFTPEDSGYYKFYTDADGADTYMYLYNSDFELLEENDDYDGLNAGIIYYLEAGETYYIGLAFLSSDEEGSFDFICMFYSYEDDDDEYTYYIDIDEDDIAGEAVDGGTYTVYVEAGGVTCYSFTPEETAYYVFYTVTDEYDTYMYLYDSDYGYLASNDDGGSGYNAKIKYYFEAGETYYVGLAFYSEDTEGSYEFVCERYYAAVSAQVNLTTEYVELIEGIDSYTGSDGYEYYYVDSDNFSYGDQIIVTFEDGSTETYTFDGTYYFYNEDGEEIYEWYWDSSICLEVGDTYDFTIYLSDLDDVSLTIPVKIIENPYVSAAISLSADSVLEQGIASWLEYDEEAGTWYDYYSVYYIEFTEGDTITITDEDGAEIVYEYTVETYDYGDGETYTYEYFADEYGNYLSYSLYYDYDQEEDHWEIGDEIIVTMYLYDYDLSINIPVVIAENPYSGATITLDFAEDIVLSECTDAYEAYDADDEVYNRYSFWNIDFSEGDQIIITFEDGTTATYTYSVYYSWTYTDDDGEEITEYEYWFIDEDENYMYYSIDSDQYYNHWYAGNTYYFILEIEDYGLYVEIPVTVSDHDWELTEVITAATCTEEGSGTYTCADCGETKTDVIAATGHSYEVTEYVEATGTTDGYIVYTCSVCGDTYTEVIAASGSTSGSISGTSGTSGSSSASDSTSPETGDNNSLALWIMLAVLAAAGAGIGFAKRRFE